MFFHLLLETWKLHIIIMLDGSPLTWLCAMTNDTQSRHFGVHMKHLPLNPVSVVVRTWAFLGIWDVVSLTTALLALVLGDFIFKKFCCWSSEWFLLSYIYSDYPSLQGLILLLDISVSVPETSVKSLIWFIKWVKMWGFPCQVLATGLS